MTKATSTLTREQFVQQEIAMGVEAQGIPGVDFSAAAGTFDPDVVEAIHKRAEWNAQAAERAGVTWRQEPETKVADALDACCPFCGSGEVELHSSLGSSTGSGRALLCMCCLNCQARGPAVRESVESIDSAKWRYDDIEKAGLLWRTRTKVPVGGEEKGSSQEVEPQVPDALTMDIIERLNQHFNRLETQKTAIDRLREQIRNTERTVEQHTSRLDQHKESIAQWAEDQLRIDERVDKIEGADRKDIDRSLYRLGRRVERLEIGEGKGDPE